MPSLPQGTYTFTIAGDKLTIALPEGVRIAEVGRRPRNALSIQWGPHTTEVVAIPGAQIRVGRVGRALVVDLLDPPSILPVVPQASQVLAFPASGGGSRCFPISA